MELPKIQNEVIFSVLRTLKQANPGDTYLENYLWHWNKRKETFYDTYHLMWQVGIVKKPKRILEIGVRTGISICQLLSAYIDYSGIENIVLCDIFNDGFCSPGLVKMNLNYLGILKHIENKLIFLTGDSKVEIPKYCQVNPHVQFDYILVDGSHDKKDARADLDMVKPLVSSGGVIVFDDIGMDGCDLKDVWEEFKSKYSNEFTFTENYDGKGVGCAIKN